MIPDAIPHAAAGAASTSPGELADPLGDVTRLTPSAPVTEAAAAAAVQGCFGLGGELARLPGEADDNFLLTSPAGRRYVVKFAHLRADPEVVNAQAQVLGHLEAMAADLPVPRVVPAVDGQLWTVVADGPLAGRVVHVLTYLDGRLLRSVPTSATLRRRLGSTLAALAQALRTFDGPLVRRPLLWDLAQLPRLRPLLAELPPGPDTSRLDEQLSRFTAEVAPRLAAQRRQLVHNDFSPDNVLVDTEAGRVAGIIDFGDVTVTALVSDVAIAAAYQLSADPTLDTDPTHAPTPDLLAPALDLISGYHAVTPLTGDEQDLLADLMLARILARIVISEWRAVRFPDNRAYILRNTPRAWQHLSLLLALPAAELTARIHRACRPEPNHA